MKHLTELISQISETRVKHVGKDDSTRMGKDIITSQTDSTSLPSDK